MWLARNGPASGWQFDEFPCSVHEESDVLLDHGQRRAEFMRHVINECVGRFVQAGESLILSIEYQLVFLNLCEQLAILHDAALTLDRVSNSPRKIMGLISFLQM